MNVHSPSRARVIILQETSSSGEVSAMIKWTAIISFIGVQDLLDVAIYILGQTYDTVTVLGLLAALCWILTVLCGCA
ncbi:hypothetical protein BSN85_31860 [Bradyrhizobium brasilense]|uniref:hypothetical protein n=1 Tax=Bradyrhizobium brasilense TaxID=1419277 RepID=UPI0009761133|nr:hypothetical protein [Bradyrhizobium brasilense]OMI01608.1 hypothetical protein BSN85_31860 [Bradyrhizobium brasilense]